MTERKTISAVRNTVTLKRENPATAGVSECRRHSCYYNALLQRMQGAIDRSNTAKLEGRSCRGGELQVVTPQLHWGQC